MNDSGFADINGTRIFYEVAGNGRPFVMIHAGVADSRQWNNEFAHFADTCRVLRYDLRGYGRSPPAPGEFRHIADLEALSGHLAIDSPAILMGCSMGGTLAMDFALAHPSHVSALIVVGSGPSGLKLDVPQPEKFAEVERAFEAGDMGRVAELEVQIWFDGIGREPGQVDQAMRRLALDMNRIALTNESKNMGKRLPDAVTPAAERLNRLDLPVLVVVGRHDIPYILAAADYMEAQIPGAQKVEIEDAAHLANMDQPAIFRRAVESFLNT